MISHSHRRSANVGRRRHASMRVPNARPSFTDTPRKPVSPPAIPDTRYGGPTSIMVGFSGQLPTSARSSALFGSGAILHVRSIDRLLAIADDLPEGVLILRAESFDGPDCLDLWRSVHPSGWATILVVSPNTTSIHATLDWLCEWPLPVHVEHKSGFPLPGASVAAIESLQHAIRVLPYIARRVRCANPFVATNLVAIYGAVGPPNSLQQLAVECQMSERHVRRVLRTLGVESTCLYFAASRVLRAYNDVASGQLALDDIARRHGFGTSRTLRSQWGHVVGVRLSESRGGGHADGLVGSVVQCLFG